MSPKVFVSYRHVEPDATLAGELEKYLLANGVAVFRDRQIRIGDQWAVVIDEALKESSHLVVLLSRASVSSDHVCEEVRRAHGYGMPILPIQIEGAFELPFSIGPYVNGVQIRTVEEGGWDTIRREILALVSDQPLEISEELQPETGTVSLDSPYYVRREVDGRIETRLQGRGTTVLLKGPRQVGKSSLLVRAEALARLNGLRVSRIDFQLVDDEHRQSLKSLLKHLAYCMASDFATEIEPDHVWDERLGSKKSLTRFMEKAVLKASASRVVLCLDEVDGAFGASYCNDFFGMLRFWHNERATSSLWSKLHLVITHSTDPALWISDLDMSPFNVGERHALTDFSEKEVRDLASRYRVGVDVGRLMQLVGGHPFLIRKALYSLKTESAAIDDLRAQAAGEDGPFSEHLRLLHRTVHHNDELRAAFAQIMDRGGCDSERAFQRLHGAGLVKGDSRGAAAPRCELYRLYFAKRL